jgi:hypothetical protein
VHLDWIQTTAAILSDCWEEIEQRRVHWPRPLLDGGGPDPSVRHEVERRIHLWNEIIPLFQEAQTYLPLDVWSGFKHIRTPHDAQNNPAEAAKEWERLRDYALDRLSKSAIDAGPAPTEANIDDDATLPPSKIAELYHVDLRALNSRLIRWRKDHDEGWIENTNRKPRVAQFLYRIGSIRPIIDGLKTNSKRTAKKKSAR